jgi:hypothetical protein
VDLSLWFLLGGQLRAFREQGFHEHIRRLRNVRRRARVAADE